MSKVVLSLVIPVLNEESCLRDSCEDYVALQNNGVEVIIVDGGSSDATIDIVRNHKLTLIHAPRGRAAQMNAGADKCNGNCLLFLHADSRLPAEFLSVIDRVSNTPWGFFSIKLTKDDWLYRAVSLGINLRSRIFKVATGDQGIFVQAGLFKTVGGFRELDLMEDIDLSRRLKRRCQPFIVTQHIISSARRWESKGVVRTALLMWFLQLAFKLGVSPKKLAKWYQ